MSEALNQLGPNWAPVYIWTTIGMFGAVASVGLLVLSFIWLKRIRSRHLDGGAAFIGWALFLAAVLFCFLFGSTVGIGVSNFDEPKPWTDGSVVGVMFMSVVTFLTVAFIGLLYLGARVTKEEH